jgi:hypothetical protein
MDRGSTIKGGQMNHRPFEDWLLDDEALTAQQERDLQAHLRDCTACSSIAASNLALHSTRWAVPKEGFSGRYQIRLEAWRRQQRRQMVLGTLVLVIGGLGLLYALAAPIILQLLHSPADWIAAAAGYLVLLLTSLRVLGEVGGILLRDVALFISPLGWSVLLLTGTGLGVFWVLSVRRLARTPQGVWK